MTRGTPRNGKPAPGPRRIWLFWMAALLVVAATGVIVLMAGSKGTPPPGAPGEPSGKSADMSALSRLIGRWQRPDGGYVLTVRNVDPDGQVDASYDNPRPIHVAKAQAATRGGEVGLYVELRDRNYPGSFYTLVYDAGRDRLAGIYHHLGLKQEFEVEFVRIR